MDAAHGEAEILARSCPAGGIDAGGAAERLHLQAGIVGERGQARALGGRECLEARVALEGGLGLLRFGEAEVTGRDGIEAVRRYQLLDLPHLAGIVARHHETASRRQLLHSSNPQMRGSANSTELPTGSRT